MSIGQPVDLFLEHGHAIIPVVRIKDKDRPRGDRSRFVLAPASLAVAGPSCHAVCDPMQPRAQRVFHPERPGFLDQDQKGRLKSVIGVMPVAKSAPADAQNHRTVPLDQGREGELGRLGIVRRKPLQKLTVGQVADRPQVEQGVQLSHDNSIRSSSHEGDPRRFTLPKSNSYGSNAARSGNRSTFCESNFELILDDRPDAIGAELDHAVKPAAPLDEAGSAPHTALDRRDMRANRPGQRRARAGVDAEHARTGCGGEMEWAGIIRDHEVALKRKSGKLPEPGPAAEVNQRDRPKMSPHGVDQGPIAGRTHRHDRCAKLGGRAAADLGKVLGRPSLG